jgi:hypothetical protein
MTNQKQYLAFWGDGYATQEERRVDAAYFTEDNGYSAEDQEAIAELEIGGVWRSQEPAEHTITRLS